MLEPGGYVIAGGMTHGRVFELRVEYAAVPPAEAGG